MAQFILPLLLSLIIPAHSAEQSCTIVGVQTAVTKPPPNHISTTFAEEVQVKFTIPNSVSESCSDIFNTHNDIRAELSLQMFQNLYHSTSKIKHYRSDGTVSESVDLPQIQSYLGSFSLIEIGAVNSNSDRLFSKGKVSLTFVGSRDWRSCPQWRGLLRGEDFVYSMDVESRDECGVEISRAHDVEKSPLGVFAGERKSVMNRRRLQIQPTSNCFPNQYAHLHSMKIGLVLDPKLIEKWHGGSLERTMEAVTSIMTDVNGIYENQFNIHVSIGDVLHGTVTGLENFLGNCDLQNHLGVQWQHFNVWRREYYWAARNNCTAAGYSNDADCPTADTHAAIGLLGGCGWGGGVAFQPGICDFEWGVFTTNWYGRNTMIIVGHEIGHLMNAQHLSSFPGVTTADNGLMRYESGNEWQDFTHNGAYQYNPMQFSRMCGEISNKQIRGGWDVPHCFTSKDMNTVTYRWRQAGTYSPCLPCGPESWTTQNIECVKSNLDGTIVVVDDFDCNTASKPFGKFARCGSLADGPSIATCPTPVCGNGVLDKGEECEVALDASCCTTACKYKWTDASCATANLRIDAAFQDAFGFVHVFQGEWWSKYSSFTSTEPVDGWPKAISAIGLESWVSNLGGAFCAPDNTVYFFRGTQFITLDLDLRLQTRGATAISILGNPTIQEGADVNFHNCINTNGAHGAFTDGAKGYVFCDNTYVDFYLGAPVLKNHFRPVFGDYDLNFGARIATDLGMDAILFDSVSRRHRFYKGDLNVEYEHPSQVAGFPHKNNQFYRDSSSGHICVDSGCDVCDFNGVTCSACATGMMLHDGICYSSTVLVVLEADSGSTWDNNYIDHSATSNLQYSPAGLRDGAFDMADNSRIHLKSLSLSNPSPWVVSMYVRPTFISTTALQLAEFHHANSIVIRVFVEPVDMNGVVCGYGVKMAHTVINGGAEETTDLMTFGSCYHSYLPLNEWSKMSVAADAGFVEITIRGISLSTGVEPRQVLLNFNAWALGADVSSTNGFVGLIDYVIMSTNKNIVAPPPTPAPSPGQSAGCSPPKFPWVKTISIGLVVLSLYTVLLGSAIYMRLGRQIRTELIDMIHQDIELRQDGGSPSPRHRQRRLDFPPSAEHSDAEA